MPNFLNMLFVILFDPRCGLALSMVCLVDENDYLLETEACDFLFRLCSRLYS